MKGQILSEDQILCTREQNRYIYRIYMVSHGHICRRLTWPTLMSTNTTTTELLRTTSVSCFSLRPSGQTKTCAKQYLAKYSHFWKARPPGFACPLASAERGALIQRLSWSFVSWLILMHLGESGCIQVNLGASGLIWVHWGKPWLMIRLWLQEVGAGEICTVIGWGKMSQVVTDVTEVTDVTGISQMS